jgi:hypothetical protein
MDVPDARHPVDLDRESDCLPHVVGDSGDGLPVRVDRCNGNLPRAGVGGSVAGPTVADLRRVRPDCASVRHRADKQLNPLGI